MSRNNSCSGSPWPRPPFAERARSRPLGRSPGTRRPHPLDCPGVGEMWAKKRAFSRDPPLIITPRTPSRPAPSASSASRAARMSCTSRIIGVSPWFIARVIWFMLLPTRLQLREHLGERGHVHARTPPRSGLAYLDAGAIPGRRRKASSRSASAAATNSWRSPRSARTPMMPCFCRWRCRFFRR